jgi:hypothetical protein
MRIKKLLFDTDEYTPYTTQHDAFGDPDNMPPDALILKMMEIGGVLDILSS